MKSTDLIEANEGVQISDLASPRDFYWVLKSPAPLAGMRMPRSAFPWKNLAAAGFSGVVALAPGTYDPSPLKLLFSERIEDLCHGGNPQNPNREERLITQAVETVVGSLQSGRGVVVHCMGGRGRTGTVLGGALRGLGYGAQEHLPHS